MAMMLLIIINIQSTAVPENLHSASNFCQRAIMRADSSSRYQALSSAVLGSLRTESHGKINFFLLSCFNLTNIGNLCFLLRSKPSFWQAGMTSKVAIKVDNSFFIDYTFAFFSALIVVRVDDAFYTKLCFCSSEEHSSLSSRAENQQKRDVRCMPNLE